MTALKSRPAPRPLPKRAMSAVLTMIVLAAAPAPYSGSSTAVLVLAVAAVLVSLTDAQRTRPTFTAVVPFLMVVLAFASCAWSALPIVTLTAAAKLAVLTLAALAVVQVLSIPEVVRAVTAGLRAVLLLSVAVALAVPSVGLVSSAYGFGALQGVFVHRNALAFVAVLSLTASFLTRRSGRRREAMLFDVGLSVFCLLAAQSQSSLVGMIVVVMMWSAVGMARRLRDAARNLVLVVTGLLVVLGVFVATSMTTELTQGLGRDTTFTGRTEIWTAVLAEVPRHPLLGAGWEAVWQPGLPITYRMWTAITFPVYTAHNGYLDFLLQLGVVSLVVLGVLVLTNLGKGLALSMRRPEPSAMWPFSVTAVLIVANLTESQFTSEIGWMTLCLAYLSLNVSHVRPPSDAFATPRPAPRALTPVGVTREPAPSRPTAPAPGAPPHLEIGGPRRPGRDH